MTTISIIGTAGRKEDGALLVSSKYWRMVELALWQITRDWKLPLEEVILVSGGAAWADHVAVTLTKAYPTIQGCILHLPAQFSGGQFVGSQDAQTANYYHKLFSQKMGLNSLVSLDGALNSPDRFQVHVGNGFKDRNNQVAKSDRIIAFTFGPGSVPKDGGTKHTWDMAGPGCIKVHHSLRNM